MLEAERPRWGENVKRVMGVIETILPPCSCGQVAADRLKYLERITTLLLRFGSERSDPIASMLAHVGNYWSSAILVMLQSGPLRPSTVQKLIATLAPDHPISQRMLTLNLRALEQDGLIERVVHHSRRAHVEYRLTCLGRELGKLLLAIIEWGADNVPRIVAAREEFERNPVSICYRAEVDANADLPQVI